MNELYFETHNIKIKLTGTNELVQKIEFVDAVKISDPTLYLELVKTQIEQYFNGEINKLDFRYYLDTTPFKTQVYLALMNTKKGDVLSYRELGEKIDSKAYQAIGSAMKTNPLPLLIPCHRVIKNNREIGNFAGGVETKKKLIALESNSLDNT